jgi:hypothetical protein
MTVWQLILHLFNFVLPALAMALLMPWAGRWVMGVGGTPFKRRMLVHAVVAGAARQRWKNEHLHGAGVGDSNCRVVDAAWLDTLMNPLSAVRQSDRGP